ncbi:hypothetical protein [Xanthomonas translucens]|uniref:hypothetical protein n=1 Tax=Xanthomonas campestris pv. translucens TaxID=343 RepID=UPI001F50DD49|nr:hypothetical protein [Xanthomonas translucens]
MRNRFRWKHKLLLLELLLALWASAAQLAAAQPSGPPVEQETLYLEVTLNETRKPGLFRFQRDGERMQAEAATLRQIGLRIDAAANATIALESLDGVRYRYDAGLQQLAIDAPVALLDVPLTRIDAQDSGPALPATSSPGALLDYDLYASRQGNASNLTASGELRAFGLGDGVLGRGMFRQSFVGRLYREPQRDWRSQAIRLDTQWQWSLPDSMTSVVVGDTLSSSTSWSRTLRLGGIRVGRDFGLQPYRVTTPLPEFLGEVTVPSNVDLYVNGIRQYGSELPAGPFQLSAAPGVDGAGNAQLVITDAYGRSRSVEIPFYATQDLLADGLDGRWRWAGSARATAARPSTMPATPSPAPAGAAASAPASPPRRTPRPAPGCATPVPAASGCCRGPAWSAPRWRTARAMAAAATSTRSATAGTTAVSTSRWTPSARSPAIATWPRSMARRRRGSANARWPGSAGSRSATWR